jgi:hypothetical protein
MTVGLVFFWCGHIIIPVDGRGRTYGSRADRRKPVLDEPKETRGDERQALFPPTTTIIPDFVSNPFYRSQSLFLNPPQKNIFTI